MTYEYRKATSLDLDELWNKNIAKNPRDKRWKNWKKEYISYNKHGLADTFTVICDSLPIGEGTLLYSPECSAIKGREILADNISSANINSLRIEKDHEGKGHISKLIKLMEDTAVSKGYTYLTIGVKESKTRNRAIYAHLGFNELILTEIEKDESVLYYRKKLPQ